MNILNKLEDDHKRFKALISRLDTEVLDSGHKFSEGWTKEAGETCVGILKELLPGMERHEEIERRLLYPEMLKRAPVSGELLGGMEGEHSAIDHLLEGFMKELPKSSQKPTSWMILNLLRLTSLLQRHMLREEQELFSVARKHIPSRELERLGREAEAMGASV